MTRPRRWWWVTLLALAAVLTEGGCSQSSKSPAHASNDAGPDDASACGDDCVTEDAADTGSAFVDTGWVCPIVPGSSAGATCDVCIQAHCDAVWCTCAQDKFGNEAGIPGCFAYLACLEGCPADGGDAGTFTATEEQEAQAVVACIAQSCATECPTGVTLTL